MLHRREFLKSAAAGAALLATGCGSDPAPRPEENPGPAPPPATGDFPAFDAHTHPVVMGEHGVEVLIAEMRGAGVEGALVMPAGLERGAAEGGATPTGLDAIERMANRLAPNGPFIPFAGVNPARADAAALERTRAAARKGLIRGLKIYLGYVHAWASDERYKPFYRLAAELGLPVMLHTGDTYSKKALLKYAQPLTVDEVAVEFPSVKFILAHLGNPWTLEAAEVIYKNENVYADLSGFAVGGARWFSDEANAPVLDDVVARIRQAFLYAEKPERFLYGSDWPLVPMREYRELIVRAIPPEHHRAVFRENARDLFGR